MKEKRLAGLSTGDAFKHMAAEDLGMVAVQGETLHQLQGVLLDMLIDIAAWFEVCDIEYLLFGGSCIGAVRHQGFIPWDDDIDIAVPRESYERMRATFDAAMGDRYWLHTPEDTPGNELGFARIRRKGTVVRTREDLDTEECGAQIDVFVLEDVPDSTLARKVHGMVSMALGFALSCRRFAARRDFYMQLASDDKRLAKAFLLKAALGRAVSFCSAERWCRAWNLWNALYCNPNSRYIACPSGVKHYLAETYPREMMLPPVSGVFEGAVLNVPHHAVDYLHFRYGNYEEIPPESEREAHLVFELDLSGDSQKFRENLQCRASDHL